jgi:uncharacterized protein (DUF58 family)
VETDFERIPSIFVTFLVQIFVVFFLFVALLYGERDLILFCLLVLGMSLGARLWSRLCLSGVQSRSHLNRIRIFPGETVELQTKVENTRFMPTRIQIQLPFANGAFAPFIGQERSKECALLWYQEARVRWTLTARKRGLHRIGPPKLAVGDLFGFFLKGSQPGDPIDVIVYPRLRPVRPLPLKRRELFGVPGASKPVEDPIYVYGTREYQYWRPARFIHWKASARHDRLQEKVFEPSEQAKVLIALEVDDFLKHEGGEAFERSLEVAASIATMLARDGAAVGIVTNGLMKGGGAQILPIARSPQQFSAVLESMARVQMKSDRPLVEILRKGFRLPWGVTCLFFAYRRGESSDAIEAYFRHRQVPIVSIFSLTPPHAQEERLTPQRGSYALDDIALERVEAP